MQRPPTQAATCQHGSEVTQVEKDRVGTIGLRTKCSVGACVVSRTSFDCE
eukprot:CAMPEP_0202839972 /NCGR_PEP_ID=MMETSP1389-20130828/54413_1 /ASSEMBLY_ACC=CAM_ASM_000865 /TAXON_ID=302021 /ORGANISM="Rhodomonas sp., Strain CCMP768" /LENGTH=49 /DNA_ID= /DNA_START= /DNA_END= /DNA_ORIENTATION=